jgi:hypothetical protein
LGHAARPIEFGSSLPDTTYRADGGGGLEKREHSDRPAHLVNRRAIEETLPQTVPGRANPRLSESGQQRRSNEEPYKCTSVRCDHGENGVVTNGCSSADVKIRIINWSCVTTTRSSTILYQLKKLL